jgi:hypothetical protein
MRYLLVGLSIALAGFFLAQGLFSGKIFLRKNIFFPEKIPEK